MSSRDGWKAGDSTSNGFWEGLIRILFGTDDSGKNAFDSFGYGMTSGTFWGDPTDTVQFRTGGGFVGWLVDLKNKLVSVIPGGDGACGVIQNPFVRIGGMVLGIVATFFSGGTVGGFNVAANIALSFAISTAMSFIVPIAGKILTNDLITGDEMGGTAGNAITSAGVPFKVKRPIVLVCLP